MEPDLLLPSEALNQISSDELITESVRIEERQIQHGYSIGQFNFLVKELTCAEIMEDNSIFPLPKTQPGLRGLINARGSLIPVFDLKQLLNIKKNQKEYILVLGTEDDAVGIIIDSLPIQPSIKKQMQQTPPLHDAIKDYISHTYMDEENLVWMDFDYASFFISLANRN